VGFPGDPAVRRFLTDEVLVQLASGQAVEPIAAAVGALATTSVELLPDYYLLRVPGVAGALGAAETLRRTAGVLSAEPQLAWQPVRKLVPNDTYFSRLWHLLNTGQNSGTAGIDLRVTNVWNRYRGAGIVIGIVDDGFAYAHPDLAPNYVAG